MIQIYDRDIDKKYIKLNDIPHKLHTYTFDLHNSLITSITINPGKAVQKDEILKKTLN